MSDPGPDLTPGILGPCEPYCTLDDLCDNADFDGKPENAADAIIDASEILYALLGRSLHGICTATVETDAACDWWVDGRAQLGGWWEGRAHLGWARRNVINLQAPVVSIDEVSVDGDVLDPALYVLRDGSALMYADSSSWTGVVRITYSFGAPIPRYARDACVELATELWKERCGSGSCLPANTSSVARQGITATVDQNVQRVREAGPALPKVMVAMSVINPTGQRQQAEVWSPDDPNSTHVVRTFEAP